MIASTAQALSPSVETTPASSAGETTATLDGDVNPNGLETKTYFEYGTTTSYGSKTTEVGIGAGTTTVKRSVPITGLKANTTYHYRIVATNASGTSQGTDKTLITLGQPEAFTWGATPESGGEAATLKAWIDPNGQSTTYQFEYGTSSGLYTTTVPVPAASAGSEYSGHFVTYKITGLMPGTRYYYRAIANNASGEVLGNEVSFASSNVPGLVTLPASEITQRRATLKATIDSHALATKYYFEYGVTTGYGGKVPFSPKEVSSEPEVTTVSEAVTGLNAGTLYHYRVRAENSAGISYGTDQTFTTDQAVTLEIEGKPIEKGTKLDVSSSNFYIGNEESACEETKLSGPVEQNPEVFQKISTTTMHNEGEKGCLSLISPYTVTAEYSAANEWWLEYAVNSSGEGVVRSMEFTLRVSYGYPLLIECKYNLSLSGTYEIGSPIVSTLAGKVEYVSGSGFGCPRWEQASGTFAVTSGGVAVEAS